MRTCQASVLNRLRCLLKQCRNSPELFNQKFLNRPPYWSVPAG